MKLLRIVLSGEEHPHYTITKAFEKKFDCTTLFWEHLSRSELNRVVFDLFKKFSFDVVFMQLQSAGVIYPETAQMMASKSLVFNWTGDVRSDLSWCKEIAAHTITLFTNETDVISMKSQGYRSDFLQVGYDNAYYKNQNAHRCPTIVFCGNYYPNENFPLTDMRIEMIKRLKQEFPRNFFLYGRGWEQVGVQAHGFVNNTDEAFAYNTCTIGISLSHFDYRRYFSDRLLRIMACGCLALSHNYQLSHVDFENEKEFVSWNNIDELIKLCHHYLKVENYQRGREIAEAGMRKVETEYIWDKRVSEFEKIINRYKK